MASAVAMMMIGGAVVNAFAFTGGNYLFSIKKKDRDMTKQSNN